MFTFAEVKERRERKKKTFLGTEEEFGDRTGFFRRNRENLVSREIFPRIFTRNFARLYNANSRGRGGISSTKEERSPHMFYQGTLWYRRRFKGDSTMFTECRGPRQIDGGREGRAKRCIEACMPLVGLSCKPPFLEPALLRHSTLLYIPFDEHPLPRYL